MVTRVFFTNIKTWGILGEFSWSLCYCCLILCTFFFIGMWRNGFRVVSIFSNVWWSDGKSFNLVRLFNGNKYFWVQVLCCFASYRWKINRKPYQKNPTEHNSQTSPKTKPAGEVFCRFFQCGVLRVFVVAVQDTNILSRVFCNFMKYSIVSALQWIIDESIGLNTQPVSQ